MNYRTEKLLAHSVSTLIQSGGRFPYMYQVRKQSSEYPFAVHSIRKNNSETQSCINCETIFHVGKSTLHHLRDSVSTLKLDLARTTRPCFNPETRLRMYNKTMFQQLNTTSHVQHDHVSILKHDLARTTRPCFNPETLPCIIRKSTYRLLFTLKYFPFTTKQHVIY